MAEYHIAAVQEFTDNNGMKLSACKIRNRNKKQLFERLMFDGIQIVSGAALAACTWKLNLHPIFTLGLSAMSIEGGVNFYKNMRKYIGKSSLLLQERIRLTTLLANGTVTYFANVVLFSWALKQNNRCIPYLGVAAVGYFLTVWSNNMLGRTILNMTPVFKCYQLLFGPTLIASAAFYLLSLQKHDEQWLGWLSLVASTAVGINISKNGRLRGANRREQRWLLFKGLELLVGGCILCINGAVLLFYAINNYFYPLFTLGFFVYYGSADVINALKCIKTYARMDGRVYDCIIGMIVGPIIFFSACICFKLVKRVIMLPGFLFISGTGLALLGKSILNLHDLVPPPVFIMYSRRVLGPVMIAYSTFTSAYIGYRMGWRYSMVLMPLIPIGINATYRGWKE